MISRTAIEAAGRFPSCPAGAAPMWADDPVAYSTAATQAGLPWDRMRAADLRLAARMAAVIGGRERWTAAQIEAAEAALAIAPRCYTSGDRMWPVDVEAIAAAAARA